MKQKVSASAMTWVPVGELAENFVMKRKESNTPVPNSDLVGKNVRLYLENGRLIELRFQATRRLLASLGASAEQKRWTVVEYLATLVRDGVYFVDFIWHRPLAESYTIVLDTKAGIFTAVTGRLPTRSEASEGLLSRAATGKELTGVLANISNGSIDKPFDEARTPRHKVTDELLGKRAEYSYTATQKYQHIYLTEKLYTWHCIAGVEKGLADTDLCHYYKLASNLYLFVWQEKIIPTLGIKVVDFETGKAHGKLFGYKGNDFGKLSNTRFVERVSLLSP